MAEIQITTTQNVPISFRAAEANERIAAYVIDWLIKYSYVFMVFFAIIEFLENYGTNLSLLFDTDTWSVVALVIILCSPVIFYTLLLETLLAGQTIGKKIMKLQVVKIDGYQAAFIDFFIRWAMRLIDVNSFYGVVALVAIGSSKNNQRLGGIASGTAVISFRKKASISQTILENITSDYQPLYPSVIKLSDNDVRIIKENYLRAKEKSDHGTMIKIREKIIQVTQQEPDSAFTAEQFIRRVISDYNYYTQNM